MFTHFVLRYNETNFSGGVTRVGEIRCGGRDIFIVIFSVQMKMR